MAGAAMAQVVARDESAIVYYSPKTDVVLNFNYTVERQEAGIYAKYAESMLGVKEWVKEMRFERMGCFAYSDEEGTYANKHYKDDIPQEVKDARAAELMAIQQEISGELMQRFVGRTEKVIIDREEGEYFIGRTQYDSPEVDCEVLISHQPSESSLQIGEFYEVEITKAEEFDLYGVIKRKLS